MSENIIEIKNINVSYGSNHVLKDINLNIPAYSTVGIVGSTGSGKTTTLYSILRHLNDDKRNIYTLRSNYLDTVFADMREIMSYTNSSQYIDTRTKKGSNLRILSFR